MSLVFAVVNENKASEHKRIGHPTSAPWGSSDLCLIGN